MREEKKPERVGGEQEEKFACLVCGEVFFIALV
jgi:hypothetical protein